jgi:putative restriction endonuclease
VKYWVGITDKEWFDRLSAQGPDEVNFWQPSSKPLAGFLQPGVPFLFKLHSPNNFIVGGGFFVSFSALPARLAWDCFGDKNGVASYAELKTRVQGYRGAAAGDPEIGCNVLNHPFFFQREDWIPAPDSWKAPTQRGKTFDSLDAYGERLWLQVSERLTQNPAISPGAAEGARYGAEYITRARLGQGAFRVLVTDAYTRRCAISGERTLPVLEAAHIRPYADRGAHQVSNGLLLRSDLHTLFDRGYLTVTPERRIEVSRKIKEEFENGREYYRYHGQSLLVCPADEQLQPAADLLAWHNNSKYLG